MFIISEADLEARRKKYGKLFADSTMAWSDEQILLYINKAHQMKEGYSNPHIYEVTCKCGGWALSLGRRAGFRDKARLAFSDHVKAADAEKVKAG
jgi:hypothetical protein